MDLFSRFDPPAPQFKVTAVAHEGCARCSELAADAMAFAKVRGSIGGTSSESYRLPDGSEIEHSATVRREDFLPVEADRG